MAAKQLRRLLGGSKVNTTEVFVVATFYIEICIDGNAVVEDAGVSGKVLRNVAVDHIAYSFSEEVSITGH